MKADKMPPLSLNYTQYNKKSGVYRIINLVDGKVYIGSSRGLYDRIKRHRLLLINNKHDIKLLQNSFNELGINKFSIEVIELCGENLLHEREEYWIEKMQCVIPNGYNTCINGYNRKGLKASIETRLKMSSAGLGKKKKPFTVEHIAKLHTFKKGCKMYQVPVILYDSDNNKIKEFENMSEGAKEYGIAVSTISNNLYGRSKTTRVGIWKKII